MAPLPKREKSQPVYMEVSTTRKGWLTPGPKDVSSLWERCFGSGTTKVAQPSIYDVEMTYFIFMSWFGASNVIIVMWQGREKCRVLMMSLSPNVYTSPQKYGKSM